MIEGIVIICGGEKTIFHVLTGGGEVMRAVVSKRGVDDGNQKGGGSLQPAKENHYNYI